MNVCVINDSFPPLVDGIANTVVNYGRVINNGLGKATVCVPYYPDTDDSSFSFDVVRYPSIDTTGLVGYRAGVPFDAETISGLEERNFDIIHSHCPIASSMLGRVLREQIDKPLVFTYHTKYDLDINHSLRGHLIQEGAIKMLVDNVAASDEVWAVSDGAGKNIQAMGYQGDYIVMPNGVDFEKGRLTKEEVNEITGGYDLPKDVPVYLFVGRIMWYKGCRIILDALKMLKDHDKDFRMVFIGNGVDKDEIVEYSNTLGLSDKVIFLGAIYDRRDLKAWYCRANLFLFPSSFDTNGLVVREAAACALPSVLIKGSCAAEDTKDFDNAFWIDENTNSMYALLDYLGYDLDKMARIGQNAMDEIYISWDDSIKRAYERYGVVLDNYKAGKCPTHDKLTDLFFDKTGDAIDDLLRIERTQNRMILNARKDLREVYDEVLDVEMEFKNKIDKIRYVRDHVSSDLKEKYEKSIDFILKQIDRYK